MSMYAVVDPATGEKVKEYPTTSDDDLRAAIGRADEVHRTWSASSTVAEGVGMEYVPVEEALGLERTLQ